MNISVLKNEQVPEVVEYLKEALERAERGETVGVLVVEQTTTGSALYSVSGIKDRFKVSGFLFHALHRLQQDDT